MPSHDVDVEREYRARIDAMSVAERIRRAEVLFVWSRDFLRRSILQTYGPLSKRELAWELAMRLYGSDEATRRWLEELRSHAGR